MSGWVEKDNQVMVVACEAVAFLAHHVLSRVSSLLCSGCGLPSACLLVQPGLGLVSPRLVPANLTLTIGTMASCSESSSIVCVAVVATFLSGTTASSRGTLPLGNSSLFLPCINYAEGFALDYALYIHIQ